MRLDKIKKTYLVAAAALGVGAMICLPRFASASVQGACSVCHTMHNSQDNAPMTFNNSTTPNDTLLRGNCIQCHTGTNDGTNVRPYVYSTTAPTYGLTGNTLAGGNFYWVDNGTDADGHNVNMLPNNPVDDTFVGSLAYPPGFGGGLSGWAAKVAAQTDMGTSGSILTCAGVAGCHGDRTQPTNANAVAGAHHADDSTIDGSTVGKSFRFLLGVTGTEMNGTTNRWEYHPDSTHHNEYKGADRAADSAIDSTTISSLCAQCHTDFHNSSSGNTGAGIQGSGTAMTTPWIRHPTDYDMNNKGSGTEYAAYTTYDPMVPVGHSTLNGTTTDSTAYGDAGGAIVMCISCHRAHGSPYADLLRWDYSGMVAGTTGSAAGTGCFKCHSTKDGA